MFKVTIRQDTRNLRDVLWKGANNFNLLRLIAAFAVIVGHAHAIAPEPPLQDFVLSVLHFDYSSSLAVNFFFFLSGLLVSDSLMRSPFPLSFLARRALRVFPGLFVCLFISSVFIGPIFTKLPLLDYFKTDSIWRYIWSNASFEFSTTRLPGVFTDSLFGLNGSLWSLRYEFICYIYMAILAGFGFFNIRLMVNLFCVSVIAVAFVAPELMPRFADNSAAHMFPACFLLGTFFAMNKQLIKLDLPRVILMWLLFWLFNEPGTQRFLFYVAFFYSAIYVGSLPLVLKRLTLPFDASLGVFLYGFVVQQCVHAVFPTMGVHGNQVISIGIALMLGVISWYAVEQPVMLWGQRRFFATLKHKEHEQVTNFVRKTREKMLGHEKANQMDEVC